MVVNNYIKVYVFKSNNLDDIKLYIKKSLEIFI